MSTPSGSIIADRWSRSLALGIAVSVALHGAVLAGLWLARDSEPRLLDAGGGGGIQAHWVDLDAVRPEKLNAAPPPQDLVEPVSEPEPEP
ncbi:MAG: hypothetical protein ACQETK_10100, partial [Pseudomonadota bacterium]